MGIAGLEEGGKARLPANLSCPFVEEMVWTVGRQIFRPVQVFIVAGALYLAINFVATQAVNYTEGWLLPTAAADRVEAAERRQKAMLAR